MQLKNWIIQTSYDGDNRIYYLKGNVYGHKKPTCPDGTYIHTSTIVSAEDKGETLEVKTRNSLYAVRKDEMDTAVSIDLVRDFCGKFLGGNFDLAGKAEAAYNEFLKNGRLIVPGMLYLQLAAGRQNCFAGALYRDADGTVREDQVTTHVGTLEDSAIMANTGVRWFAGRNSVEFYQMLYDSAAHRKPLLGFIRNVGVSPITVTFSFGGTAEIKPGELYEVRAPKQGGTE